MKTWIRLGVLLGTVGLASVRANQMLENAVAVYERERAAIASDFRAERLSLPPRHMTILRNMAAYYQREGDQAALQAIQEAQQQFVLDPTPTGLVDLSSPAPLVRLQQNYRASFATTAERRAERLAALEGQYRAALATLQADLMREGQTQEARAVADALAGRQGGGAGTGTDAAPELEIDLGLGLGGAPERDPPASNEGFLRPSSAATEPDRSSGSDGEDSFDALLDAWFD